MDFTDLEHAMARKGYVYLAKTKGPTPFRKTVTHLTGCARKDLVFDIPAYNAHLKPVGA